MANLNAAPVGEVLINGTGDAVIIDVEAKKIFFFQQQSYGYDSTFYNRTIFLHVPFCIFLRIVFLEINAIARILRFCC